jgi:putative Mg2+ transporter-C (MgtC) family protein
MFGAELPSFSEEIHVLLQAVVALAMGGIIGWEREASGKAAGLRTHMLVCLATMLFVRISQILVSEAQGSITTEILRTDPLRVLEAVVTGIAFLGAGVIFRDNQSSSAKGLTTAASLLAIAPIGVLIALDRYLVAFGVTLLVFIILRWMIRFEPRMENQGS